MQCLDTDLLVAILRGAGEALEEMWQLDREGRNATTSINAFEVFYGADRSQKRAENEESARRLLSPLEVSGHLQDCRLGQESQTASFVTTEEVRRSPFDQAGADS